MGWETTEFGVQVPAGVEIFIVLEGARTGCGTHPGFCTMDAGSSSPGDTAAGL